MKQGRTLPELAQEIERQASSKADFIARSNHIQVSSNGHTTLFLGDQQPRAVTDLAHTQIAEHLGIPTPYYRRIRGEHPDLLDRSVNTLLFARPASERRMVRTVDGQARAFLSDRYRRLDNYDLLDAVLPDLMNTPGLRFASAEVTDTRLYLKVVNERLTRDVRVGDTVQMGLVISNSEVGMGSLKVEPFSLRLVCLNGMTHTEYGTRRAHVGRNVTELGDGAARLYTDETLQADDRAFWLKTRDVVRGVLSEATLDRVVEQMRDAAGIRIDGDPVRAVETLAQRHRLNGDEQSGILRHLVEGADLSLWGLANAVTRHAADALSYDRATELEGLGGQLLALPAPEIRALVAA